MGRDITLRLPTLAATFLVVTLLAVSVQDALRTRVASAQDESPTTGQPIPTPPLVSGIEYITDETGQDTSMAPALTAATPSAPSEPATTLSPGAPVQGGVVTASLGGSDVAVSSVGGSNEVDAPKRRGKRAHRD
jgi:hypothetical protein